MQLHGTWNDAMVAVQEACDLLTLPPGVPSAGEAFYRKGELHRIQGEYSLAEKAYQEANKWGRQPQPGLARLKLAQGEQEAAKIMIRNLYDEKKDLARQARVLTAFVDLMLATDEINLAQEAARELTEIVDEIDAPYLRLTGAGESKKKLLNYFLSVNAPLNGTLVIYSPNLTYPQELLPHLSLIITILFEVSLSAMLITFLSMIWVVIPIFQIFKI